MPTSPDGEQMAWNIGDQLRGVQDALESGDRDRARELIAGVRVALAHPDMESEPDRHPLRAQLADLETWLRTGSAPVSDVYAALEDAPPQEQIETPSWLEEAPSTREPQPALANIKAPKNVDRDAPGTAETNSPSKEDIDTLLAGDASDPAESFRSGPIMDRTRGLRLIRKARRTKAKKKRSALFAKAKTHLSACVEDSSLLFDMEPKLKRKCFKSGGSKMRGDHLVRSCRSKLRWLKKKTRVARKGAEKLRSVRSRKLARGETRLQFDE